MQGLDQVLLEVNENGMEWNSGMEFWNGTLERNTGITIYYSAHKDKINICINIPTLVLSLKLCAKLSEYNNQLGAVA